MRATNEVKSTDSAATVTFDTLSAAQELRNAGLEGRQAKSRGTESSRSNFISLVGELVEGQFDSHTHIYGLTSATTCLKLTCHLNNPDSRERNEPGT